MKTITLLLVMQWVTLLVYGQVTTLTENFDSTPIGNVPAGWGGAANLGTNYGTGNFYPDHTSGSGRFAFISNGYLTTELIAAGSYDIRFWLRISSTPAESIYLGYCTNQSSIVYTYVNLFSVPDWNTTWTYFEFPVNLPSNAYITWKSAGTYKTHCIDDVELGPPSGTIDAGGFSSKIVIYPSPAADRLNVKWADVPGSSYEISLFDVNGKLVSETEIITCTEDISHTTIDIHHLPAGLYCVVVRSKGDILLMKKIPVVR